jgi:16S rRNA (cytosine1402-N4)-methyltransferase
MVEEVVAMLGNIRSGLICDATIGPGGHAEAMLTMTGKDVRLLGVDRDRSALELAQERLRSFKDRLILRHGSFDEIDRILDEEGLERPSFILLDAGLSSAQLESSRGFSVQRDECLDMRYDESNGSPAWRLISDMRETEIARAFEELGGLRHAKKLAHLLKERSKHNAPLKMSDLVDSCKEVYKSRYRKLHSATIPAMVLRILVNDELHRLKNFLEKIPAILAENGKVCILSYHSGEDRLVKQAFKNLANTKAFVLLTKKPKTPSSDEIKRNPRARSAKLRAIARKEALQ